VDSGPIALDSEARFVMQVQIVEASAAVVPITLIEQLLFCFAWWMVG